MSEGKSTHPLKVARLKLGYTQAVLADFCQLGVATIQRAEGGEPLRADTIRQICDYFSERYRRQVEPEELGLVYREAETSANYNALSVASYEEEEDREQETERHTAMDRRTAIKKMRDESGLSPPQARVLEPMW